MVVVGEEVREEGAACAPDRSNALAKETRLTPCTRGPGLWDATVDKEVLSRPVALLMGVPGSGFCAPVERARTLSQSSWHEDDVLISGRSLRPSLQPSAEPFISHTRAMCGVSV